MYDPKMQYYHMLELVASTREQEQKRVMEQFARIAMEAARRERQARWKRVFAQVTGRFARRVRVLVRNMQAAQEVTEREQDWEYPASDCI